MLILNIKCSKKKQFMIGLSQNYDGFVMVLWRIHKFVSYAIFFVRNFCDVRICDKIMMDSQGVFGTEEETFSDLIFPCSVGQNLRGGIFF